MLDITNSDIQQRPEQTVEATRENHNTVWRDSIEGIKPVSNKILCRQIYKNVGSKTDAGVIKSTKHYNKDQYLTQNADRVFEVIANPLLLNPGLGEWMTDIETEVGDIVWTKHLDSIHAPVIAVGDVAKPEEAERYYFLNYYSLMVAKRKTRYVDWAKNKTDYLRDGDTFYRVIPLNGRILFSDIEEEEKSSLEFKKKKDFRFGKVEFKGKKVKWYHNGKSKDDLDGSIEPKVGDTVIFNHHVADNSIGYYIEDDMYRRFNGDKRYFALQRWFIEGVLENA